MNNTDMKQRQLFVFEGSQEELELIQELFESGELSQLLGVNVLDGGFFDESKIVSEFIEEESKIAPQPIEYLSQWFKGIFSKNWFPEEEVFVAFANINHESNASVSRVKLYSLGTTLPGKGVILKVNIIPEADETFIVQLQLYPDSSLMYLPEGIQLIVLDESDNIIDDEKARSYNESISLEIKGGEMDDRFNVKIMLGNLVIKEYFAV